MFWPTYELYISVIKMAVKSIKSPDIMSYLRCSNEINLTKKEKLAVKKKSRTVSYAI